VQPYLLLSSETALLLACTLLLVSFHDRMNRRRTNNAFNGSRSRNNQRTATRPRRVARQNDVTHMRVFRGTSRLLLQTRNADQGGVFAMFAFTNRVADYVGSDFISSNYEQYRVKNIKYAFRPSAALLNGGLPPANTQESILYQNSVYTLMNNTDVQSFVDYDSSASPPTYSTILARPNLKLRALNPTNWTQVASFCPRTLSNPSGGISPTNNYGPNKWMSTKNLDALLHGYRGRVSNRGVLFDSVNNIASIDVMVTVQVQMRGPKNNIENLPSAITFLPNGSPLDGITSDEEEEEPKTEVELRSVNSPPIGEIGSEPSVQL